MGRVGRGTGLCSPLFWPGLLLSPLRSLPSLRTRPYQSVLVSSDRPTFVSGHATGSCTSDWAGKRTRNWTADWTGDACVAK